MKLDRRAFLIQSAATPFIFGLRELIAQEPASGAPEWFQKALQRMKETGRTGVVIVAPDPAKVEPTKLDEKELEGKAEVRESIEKVFQMQAAAAADAPRRRFGLALWTLTNEDFS